jgi:outer membrane protein, heavy metal efflux system
MKHSRPLILILILLVTPTAIRAAETNQLDGLTLEQALELAERQHPRLAEAHALVEAAAGRAQQAGALPNPELIVGAQQLPLDSDASNQREYVAGIAQPVPVGGRLGKARAAELLEQEVRARGLEMARSDLRRRVRGAFATALYQEAAARTQRQIGESAGKLVAMARARVETGDATSEELARAEMELARTKVEVRRSQAMHEQALLGLVTAMGDPGLNVKSLAGSLDAAFEIPTLEALAMNLSANPELLHAEAGTRASEARVALARAERIPDVKVEVLYHRLEGTKENTLDLGLSMPLPLFDRNQGRLREARAEAAAAEARARLTRNELNLRLRESHAQLTTALANARAFQTEILPHAETLVKAAETRYAAGDSSLADVLPVRRDWAALQLSHLESLRDVMQAWAEVAELLPAQPGRAGN